MTEIVWSLDLEAEAHIPSTVEDAERLLVDGNRAFAAVGAPGDGGRHVRTVSAKDLGLPANPGATPAQAPAFAVLACSDARVPVEMIFSQGVNAMFVARVGGNVMADACVGSLDFALSTLPSLRMLAVVGHTDCGAMRGAVGAYLDPSAYTSLATRLPLRGIVDALMPAVRGADEALAGVYGPERTRRPGYTEALLVCSVVLNAALSAEALQRLFRDELDGRGVRFGVYDIASRRVGLPQGDGWSTGVFEPPSADALKGFLGDVARSQRVRHLLDAGD